jgi:geranylgeranyl pyrophosphate synthase
MIEAALIMGGLVGGATEKNVAVLRAVGRHLGLAFQIIDDVLDATADSATLGKTAGKDAKAGKATFVKLHGLETSRRMAGEQTMAARKALATLPGKHAFLEALIDWMAARGR